MAIFIFEPDAFEKMVQVEGEDWRRHVQNFGDCGFQAFFEEWTCEYGSLTPEARAEVDWSVSTHGSGAIYGYGGYNRYAVRSTGEIVFLVHFAMHDDMIRRAVAVGFRLDGPSGFPDLIGVEQIARR